MTPSLQNNKTYFVLGDELLLFQYPKGTKTDVIKVLIVSDKREVSELEAPVISLSSKTQRDLGKPCHGPSSVITGV